MVGAGGYVVCVRCGGSWGIDWISCGMYSEEWCFEDVCLLLREDRSALLGAVCVLLAGCRVPGILPWCGKEREE